jgi:NADPH:quinone reductase-like Zn-dependent oxidoreductase
VDRVFPLTELAAALAFMESDAQVGKIVVRV